MEFLSVYISKTVSLSTFAAQVLASFLLLPNGFVDTVCFDWCTIKNSNDYFWRAWYNIILYWFRFKTYHIRKPLKHLAKIIFNDMQC